MRKQCVPGSFFSAHAQKPGNEANLGQDTHYVCVLPGVVPEWYVRIYVYTHTQPPYRMHIHIPQCPANTPTLAHKPPPTFLAQSLAEIFLRWTRHLLCEVPCFLAPQR